MQGAEQYFMFNMLNRVGEAQGQCEDHMNKGANQALLMNQKLQSDEAVKECGICGASGKMINCDDCPVAFHMECLGYTKQCPRGKWKCYFCKVIRHGIPSMFPRMAPNEKPVCDILADKKCASWEVKAGQLFDIL